MDIPPIAVVGGGRVGAALAAAAVRAGLVVTGIATRSDRRALAGAGLFVLAVPEDALTAVARELDAPDAVLVHTSGSAGLSALGDRAGRRIALHPVMTFAGTPHDSERLAGITWGVTADEPVLPLAFAIVQRLDGHPALVADDDRVRYHAALANAANHLVTLVAQSADWLGEVGVRSPYEALAPLVRAALDNVLASGDAALTGPIARGDVATVLAHVAALPPGAGRTAYLALARLTAERAGATNVLAALPSVG